MHGGGAFVRRRVEAGDPNFIRMLADMGGMERYERRRSWWEANRVVFADALDDRPGDGDGSPVGSPNPFRPRSAPAASNPRVVGNDSTSPELPAALATRPGSSGGSRPPRPTGS